MSVGFKMYSIAALLVGLISSPVLIQSSPIARNVQDWEWLEGYCPSSEVEALKTFNQSQIEGLWYIIQHYDGGTLRDCGTIEYRWTEETRSINQRMFIQKLPNELIFEITTLNEKAGFPNQGKFFTGTIDNNDFHFVDIDGSNYAVVWGCVNREDWEIGKILNQQNLVVLSRDRYFDINSSESLNATLAKSPFDRTKLKDVEQVDERCYT